jgi:hypothetical protein
MLNIPAQYGVGVDIEVEAKEAAIFKLYEKYPSTIISIIIIEIGIIKLKLK